ncbi:MAG: 4Fe-4S dicluster domain-containing protein [Dehalococcoidia bacterium]
MTKYAMVIDLDRCYGCRACMVACKIENNTPEAHFWMYVFRLESGEYPNAEMSFMPRPCQHCGNAPCVKVCPVGARYKESSGLTAMDWDRCIGCRYCEVACPYGVNYFNWKDPADSQYLDWDDEALIPITNSASPPYANPDLAGRYGEDRRRIAGGNHLKGVTEKCTFCVHRLEQGLQPACVANCPAGALHFGDLDNPDSTVTRILAAKRSWRLAEEFNTEPSVYYVGEPPPGINIRQVESIKARA